MSGEEEKPVRPGVRFDPSLNVGHVLVTVSLLLSGIVWGLRLESRVDHESDLRARIEKRLDSEQEQARRAFDEIKAALAKLDGDLDRKLDRIERKLDQKQDRQ